MLVQLYSHKQDVILVADMESFVVTYVEVVELYINKFTTLTTVSIRLFHMLVQIVEVMVLSSAGLVVDMVMSAPHHLEVMEMDTFTREPSI